MEISLTGMTVTPSNTISSGSGLMSGGIDFGWQPGQVFGGIVLERVAENTYMIRVDGKDVLAVAPYLLVKDQAITMEVQGKNNSKYMVRLLDFSLTGEGDMLKSIISQLGMEDNPLNRSLIQGSLAQELPLKPELLQQAARTLEVSGRNSPEDVAPILLAQKWGLPPNPRVLETIQAFLSGLKETVLGSESQLARLTQELAGFLDEIQVESQAPGKELPQPFQQEGVPPLPLSKEGTVLFQQVKDMLSAMILKPQEGAEKVTEQLKSLLSYQLPKLLQIGMEAQSELTLEGLKTLAETAPDKVPPQGGAISPPVSQEDSPAPVTIKSALQDPSSFASVSNGDKSGQNIDGLPARAANGQAAGTGGSESQEDVPALGTIKSTLQDARNFDITSGEDKRGQSVDSLPDRAGYGQASRTGAVRNDIPAEIHGKDFRAFGDLLEKFGQLLQEVQEAVKVIGHFQKGQDIVHQGAGIERQMAGHQIFQSIQRDGSQQDYLYFNLPFINNGEKETWGQLRILKNADGKKVIDPKRFSTVIFLNTENLGPLLLEIKVWNKDVTANGKVTEDWVAQVLKKAWPKLQAPFETMGYRLRQCQWDVGTFEKNLRPSEVDPPKTRKIFRFLDTRV